MFEVVFQVFRVPIFKNCICGWVLICFHFYFSVATGDNCLLNETLDVPINHQCTDNLVANITEVSKSSWELGILGKQKELWTFGKPQRHHLWQQMLVSLYQHMWTSAFAVLLISLSLFLWSLWRKIQAENQSKALLRTKKMVWFYSWMEKEWFKDPVLQSAR